MNAGALTRILALGSEEFVLTTMRTVLRAAPEASVTGVRERAGGLTDAIRDANPAIVVIEATSDTQLACHRLREARHVCPGALIVVIVAEFDMEIFEEATRRGALACLSGPGPSSALQTLLARDGAERQPHPIEQLEPFPRPSAAFAENPLTAREQEILGLVAEGRTNLQISRELWLAEQTVKFHLSKVYRKLGVANRTEASRFALLHGLRAEPHPQLLPSDARVAARV